MKKEPERGSVLFTPYCSSTSQQGYCNICYNRYDGADFKPLLICGQDHCVCKACLIVILRTPRCPFCRERLDVHRIRVNREILQRASKDKGGEQKKKIYIRTVQNERLVTENTANDGAQEELVDPRELVQQSLQQNPTERKAKALKVLLLVELLLLQLPFGLYSLTTVMDVEEDVCYDRPLGAIDLTLRHTMFSSGYLQFLIGTLSVYFSVMRMTIMLADGLFCSFFLLTLVAIIKSILCVVAYHWMLQEDYFGQCSSGVTCYAIACLMANYAGAALGVFLLAFAFKYNLYSSENQNQGDLFIDNVHF